MPEAEGFPVALEPPNPGFPKVELMPGALPATLPFPAGPPWLPNPGFVPLAPGFVPLAPGFVPLAPGLPPVLEDPGLLLALEDPGLLLALGLLPWLEKLGLLPWLEKLGLLDELGLLPWLGLLDGLDFAMATLVNERVVINAAVRSFMVFLPR